MKSKLIIIIAVLTIVIAGVAGSVIYKVVNDNASDSKSSSQSDRDEDEDEDSDRIIPVVGNKQRFVKLLENNKDNYGYYGGPMVLEMAATTDDAAMTGASPESALKSEADFSGTNNQVVGVDEGDLIKTDGEYLYTIDYYDNDIRIIDLNVNDFQVVHTLDIDNQTYISQLFLDNDRLVVVGSYYEYEENNNEDQYKGCYMWWGGEPFTKVLVYDVSDPSSPELVNDYQFKGNYVSGRTIDGILYFVTNDYMYYDWFTIFEEDVEVVDELVLPYYKNNKTDEITSLDYDDIMYFPEAVEPAYMNTVAIDLGDDNEEPFFKSYLGNAQNLFVSLDSLYVAMTEYTEEKTGKDTYSYEVSTNVYKFELDGLNMTAVANESVPGRIINQFSMDEHKGYFRIATTTDGMWFDETDLSSNHLYILDKNMRQVGALEGLAEDEIIYSVRFMGDKVYMVTFKQVDPLFVIDTSNPSDPTVLGYLKIPGVSEYLHPIDENHLIGFGQDAKTEGDRTFLTGFKISLFDVTDSSNPIEIQNEVIGDQGTYSELLYNHKALMYSGSKEMMAFPIQISEGDNYDITFTGGLVYQINGDGFDQLGAVSHVKAGADPYEMDGYWDYMINRFIYVDDVLYSVSNGKIVAQDLESLEVIGEIDFK